VRSDAAKRETTTIVLAADLDDFDMAVPARNGLAEKVSSIGHVVTRGPWKYVVVTPFSIQMTAGLVADELIVAPRMRESPALRRQIEYVLPCFARAAGGPAEVLRRAEVAL